MKRIAMEQSIYAQGVLLQQKGLKIHGEKKPKYEDKFKFQGQYAISKRSFDLDFDWTEENFSTRKPYFYEKIS